MTVPYRLRRIEKRTGRSLSRPAKYSAAHLVQVIFFVSALVSLAALFAFVADLLVTQLNKIRGLRETPNPIWSDECRNAKQLAEVIDGLLPV